MNNLHLKKYDLINSISIIPNDELDEVRTFIEYILYKNKVSNKNNKSIWGMWEKLPFKIRDLENDLKELRKEEELNIIQKIKFA